MSQNLKLANLAAAACAGDGTRLGLLPLLAGGRVHLYDGQQPADPDSAVGEVHDFCAATPLTLPAPAGTQSHGAITVGAIANGVCSHAGTPTWFRLYASDGSTALADGTVGIGTTDCDMNFAEGSNFAVGASLELSSWVLRIPAH